MHSVESFGLAAAHTHRFDSDNRKTGFVNAGKNLSGEAASNRIRLDDCKRAFL
jgi:hypothetical protein